MLFRLLALWLCLMAISLHIVGARAIAMTNGIEEGVKPTYAGGKTDSIVTDQLGTPTEAYNAEGEEVWSRRLDMNGNILEENYDRYAPYSEQIRIPFLFQGQYTTTKQNSLITDSATTHLNSADTSLKTQYDWKAESAIYLAMWRLLDLLGLAPWGVGEQSFDLWWKK